MRNKTYAKQQEQFSVVWLVTAVEQNYSHFPEILGENLS